MIIRESTELIVVLVIITLIVRLVIAFSVNELNSRYDKWLSRQL